MHWRLEYPDIHNKNGIPHSPSTPPTQTGAEVRARIDGLVGAFIAKHSLIHGGGFVQQMAALSTVSKDTGHTEIQARLLGYCWQHICDHWGQKNKNGKLFVPCPRGINCKMKHESPEQWSPVEQDVCVLLFESYPNNQKKHLFEVPAPKAKAGRRPQTPDAVGGRRPRNGGQQGGQQDERKPYKETIPVCTSCQGDHWQQDCGTNPHKHEFCFRYLNYGHYSSTCKIEESRYYKELIERMRVSARTEQPMRLRNGQSESMQIDKDRIGWRRNGGGDLILWTPEQVLERKLSKDLAMGEREKIIAKIRLEFPDIK